MWWETTFSADTDNSEYYSVTGIRFTNVIVLFEDPKEKYLFTSGMPTLGSLKLNNVLPRVGSYAEHLLSRGYGVL